jgi:hypothetical protein
MGFEHSVVNMFLFPFAMMMVGDFSIADYFLWKSWFCCLIPAVEYCPILTFNVFFMLKAQKGIYMIPL